MRPAESRRSRQGHVWIRLSAWNDCTGARPPVDPATMRSLSASTGQVQRRENAADGKGTGGHRVRATLGRLGSACRRGVGGRQSLFADSLAREETPEALEGLSWAAWWLDDAEAVFDARERAYRLYRRRGESGSAARMATWLAADQLDFRGAVAVAGGWLRRAERLLEPLEPGPEHGWLAFHEGYIAHLSGDTMRAEELGARAAEAGRRFDVPDLEMLGLALQGAALVACAQVEEGMRCLDEATATALAGEATIPISGAWACCFLVSACTAVLDYERAFEWCDRIAEFAERYGSRYMLAFCRAEYGAVHLWRGQWTDAEEMLEASVEDFSRSRPAMVGGPLAGLAELRRRQARAEEAALLLDQAGPSASAQLCRARLALDQGDARRAVELVERLLRHAPAERKLDRAPALELLVRARVARGELEQARVALESLQETCAARGDRAAARLHGAGRGFARGRELRARAGEDAARGRRRSLPADWRAVRGLAGADRAGHEPRRPGSNRAGGARGDRGPRSSARARGRGGSRACSPAAQSSRFAAAAMAEGCRG